MGQNLAKNRYFWSWAAFLKKNFFFKTMMLKDSPKFFLKKFGHFRPFYENLIWDHVFCIFVKKWPIRPTRPADRPACQTQKNRLELFFTKKSTSSHSLKNSLRYLHFCKCLLTLDSHKSRNKRGRPLTNCWNKMKKWSWNKKKRILRIPVYTPWVCICDI